MKSYLLKTLMWTSLSGLAFLPSCSEPQDPKDAFDCDICDYVAPITSVPYDNVARIYRGTLVVGNGIQTFQPDGVDQTFWASADHSPEVRAYFERITRSDKMMKTPFKPRRVTLTGYFEKKPYYGPANRYNGIFQATVH